MGIARLWSLMHDAKVVVHIEWSKRWRNDLSKEITEVSALSLDLRCCIGRGNSKPIPHIQLISP